MMRIYVEIVTIKRLSGFQKKAKVNLKMSKKRYWDRELSCGHTRLTNLPFIAKDYTKPKVGEECYCRQCFLNVTITGVKEATQQEYKEVEEWEGYFEKLGKKYTKKAKGE